MELIIRKYFDCWLNNDAGFIPEIFAEDVIYSECYGPEYHGVAEVQQWFKDWNDHGKVLRWDIKQILCIDKTAVVEWHFECVYDEEPSKFDGVTLAEFNEDGKIVSLKEFESKCDHYRPY